MESLRKYDVPFRLVVEPQEVQEYAAIYGSENVLTLPFRDTGSVVASRNWIKEHATKAGHKRHWQLDDDIQGFLAWTDDGRKPCSPSYSLATCEDFVDRYSNVAIAGLRSQIFGSVIHNPFTINCQAFTCVLVLNDLPYHWRGQHGTEDTDFSLQVLTGGWCTIIFHVFQFMWSTIAPGGNASIYEGDGRLCRTRELQRFWPGLVKLTRQRGRPSPDLARAWRKFDTPLEKVET